MARRILEQVEPEEGRAYLLHFNFFVMLFKRNWNQTQNVEAELH